MINISMINCPKCNTLFEANSKWGIKKFCCRSCANSRGPRSQSTKDAISATLSGKTLANAPSKTKGRQFKRESRNCKECGKIFSVRPSSKNLYCTTSCGSLHIGGYRPGSGRAKVGYYNGIYCGSTYELVWVIHCIDNNIPFKRFDNLLEYNGVKYYPDFLIGNDIIEIKGYEKQESVDRKTDVAKFHGYNVIILRKDDLQIQFDWVTSHYNTTKYHTLYDNYKPSYTYNCSHCANIFTRDKKLKTEIGYCSRKCAGAGHTAIPNPLGNNRYTFREAASVAGSPSNC